ncbi:MAG TPA: PAS domain-containing protein, partial [Anaerolineae bacterium]|nr:PAS domain-containing protein [Anaerolineae bacterium]
MQSREERLDLVLQGTNDGIWDWDMRTGEVYFSPRWKSMLGYADDEVANRKDEWNRLLHPNDLERALAAVQDYLDGRTTTYQLEHRLRHKDGTYHWVLARGIALRDEAGRAYRMVGSHTDITDRKHAEQALLESETNLRSLMENARDFAVYRIAVDPSNPYLARVVVASPSLKEVFGIPDLHDFTTWFTPIHPEDLSRIVEANRRSLEMGVPFDQQLRFFNAERGSWVWAHVRSSPVFDTDGRLTHFNGLVVDISEQKRVEDEMRRQDELLQKRLAFENLISRISTEFINLGPNEIDLGIRHALQAIGEFAGADRSYIFLVSGDGTRMANAHKWCAESIEPAIGRVAEVSAESFPWFIERMNRLEIVQIPRVADLPPEAGAEKQEFQSQSTQSLLAVPMVYRGSLVGFVGFDSVRSEKAWDEDSIALLRIVGEIFVNALEHKRAQAIQAGQRQFLELLATGGDFSGTLHTLVRLIEEQWPGMLGLVLLLDVDGRHLHIGASISLPEDYVQSIEGLEIGPMVGSCGTACYRRERVIVEDILTDPRWDGLRDLAVKYGLRACWSEPVFSAGGQVVGTFAMYYRHPRAPTAAELRAIEMAAHLVGIAIEHKRAQKALQAAYQTLEQRIEERTRELAALNAIAAVVSRSLDLKEVLSNALDKTMEVIQMGCGGAYRLEGEGDAAYLNPLVYRGLSEEFVRFAGRLPLKGSAIEVAAGSGQPLVWDVQSSPAEPDMKQALKDEGIELVVSVPLMAKGRLIGAIQMGAPEIRAFAP